VVFVIKTLPIPITLNLETIDKIEVLNCLFGNRAYMKAGFGNKLLTRLNNSKTNSQYTFTKK
jgi:hypothetical protein